MQANASHQGSKQRIMAVVLLSLSVAASQGLRPALAHQYSQARTKRDVYALPSPKQAVAFSMGYRSALAELIFAHVLVDSGLHLQERRRFDTLAAYLRTVVALDPKYPTPYHLADTLLTFQAGKPVLKNYQDAREILERGMRELPYDQVLHLTAGQYMAYLAAPQVAALAGELAAKEWRVAGARALARSCELIGSNENIPYHCITAASLFDGAGELEATRNFLRRVLAVNDDENIRDLALGYLGHALGKAEENEVQQRLDAIDELKKSDLPYIPKNRYLLLAPPFDAAQCVGAFGSSNEKCATSLRDWHEQRGHAAR